MTPAHNSESDKPQTESHHSSGSGINAKSSGLNVKNEELHCVINVGLLFSAPRWRELCGMREARKNHGLVVVNNRIYAVGGQGALGALR